jgi:hypothetical protein
VVDAPEANAFVDSLLPGITPTARDRRSVPKPHEGDLQQVLGNAAPVSDCLPVRNRHSPLEPIIEGAELDRAAGDQRKTQSR